MTNISNEKDFVRIGVAVTPSQTFLRIFRRITCSDITVSWFYFILLFLNLYRFSRETIISHNHPITRISMRKKGE